MKRIFVLLLILSLVFLVACGSDTTVFTAYVLESGVTLLVEPHVDSNEYKSSDKIAVHATDARVIGVNGKKIEPSDIQAGQTVEITYNGFIAESYPAQITASKIKVMGTVFPDN